MRLIILSLILAVVSVAQIVGAAEPQYNAPPGREGKTPYSEAVVAGDFIFLAGHLGVDPETRKLVDGGIGPETKQALTNMKAALERAGGSMDRVVKCTVFLADVAEWGAMNAVYTTFFTNKPARTALGAGGIPIDGRLEVECIALAP